jgi:UDP-N-acetyl-D-mannosaminuronate dehydrogenase
MPKNSNIDWEQVRVDAAINVMNAILSSSIMVFLFQFVFKKQISDIAVSYADKLVEELKKEKGNYMPVDSKHQ